MPNIKELLSLVDYGESGPALPRGHPFTILQSSFFWSSSSVVADPSFAWVVFMGDGDDFANGKASLNFVWPVRGGQ